MGALLLQLTPAFSPKRNELAELEPLIELVRPHRLAIELRNRRWVDEERAPETLGWFDDQDVSFVCVDAPPGDATPIMPAVDAVTRDDLAYVRIHGRNTDGYLHGKSVAERFGWIYGDEELRGDRDAAPTAWPRRQARCTCSSTTTATTTRRPPRAGSARCSARTPGRRPRTLSSGWPERPAARSRRSWRSSPSAERRESPSRARL